MPTLSEDMYKPAPRRPNKTNIVRTRTGCITCRERRKKCDEKKPACSTCARLGRRCERYKAGFNFKNVSFDTSPSPGRGSHKVPQEHDQGSSPTGLAMSSKSSPGASLETSSSALQAPTGIPEGMGALLGADATISDELIPWIGGTPSPDIAQKSPSVSLGTPFGNSGDQESPRQSQSLVEEELVPDDVSRNQAVVENQSFENFDFPTDSPITELIFPSNGNPTMPTDIQSYQLLKSPSLLANNNQVVYMDFWLHQCLPALHPIFKGFPILGNLPLVFTDTMMALSAGRLSRMLPQMTSSALPNIPGLSFRPDSNHRARSQKYYCSAIRGISDWVRNSNESQMTTTLAILILFCYWESSMGNFRDFSVHAGGATQLIQAQEATLVQQGFVGSGLMAAWVRAQMNNWWRRMHFSTAAFQRKQDPVSISPNIELTLDLIRDSKAPVLVILCESLRIYSSAVVDYWDLLRDRPIESEARVEGDACLYPYTLLMKAQAKKLDLWHTKRPLLDLPITSFNSARPTMEEGNGLTVEPLYFQSHDAAMNYAYYITARIIQSASPLNDGKTTSTQEADRWALVLLQVAASIDWEECIRLNTFAIGLSGLLLVCAIHAPKPEVSVWIQEWLEERQRTSHLEEGSFPVLQILQVLRAISRERQRGRHVYSVFQTVDDGGGRGKFHSYHSQTLTSIMVYAREGDTGNLLSYSIPV